MIAAPSLMAVAVVDKLGRAVAARPGEAPEPLADQLSFYTRQARRVVLPERCATMDRQFAFLLRCLTTTRTIDEAFRCIAEVGELYWSDSARLRVEERDGRIALVTERGGADRDRLFLHNLRSASTGLGALDWLSGGRLSELRATFAHAPISEAEIAEIFPYEARVGGDATVLSIARKDLRKPVVRCADEIAGFLASTPALAVRGANSARLQDMVRGLIGRELQLRGRAPSLEAVCDMMATSPVTLHRRLRSEQTSFRAVRDATLNALATRLLGETSASVGSIAGQLGYSDERPFRRSFERWNGCSPAAFRARAAKGH